MRTLTDNYDLLVNDKNTGKNSVGHKNIRKALLDSKVLQRCDGSSSEGSVMSLKDVFVYNGGSLTNRFAANVSWKWKQRNRSFVNMKRW